MGSSLSALYLWSLLSCGVEWETYYPPFGPLHAPAHKLFVYRLFHVDTRASCAALSRVEEDSLVGLFHSQFHLKQTFSDQ